jgi:hypothetical protein
MSDAPPTPPMPSRSAPQVALRSYAALFASYVRHGRIWGWTGGAAAVLAPICASLSMFGSFDGQVMSNLMMSMTCGLGVTLVIDHLLAQVAPPRGPMLPGIRGRATCVAALISTALVTVVVVAWPRPGWWAAILISPRSAPPALPADLAWLMRLPAIALAVTVTGYMAWLTRFRPLGLTALLVAAAMALPRVRDRVSAVLSGDDAALEVTVIEVGILLHVALWLTIAFDHRLRSIPLPARFLRRRRPGSRAPTTPRISPIAARRRRATPATGALGRIRRRRRATAGGIPVSLAGCLCGAFIVVALYVAQRVGFGPADRASVAITSAVLTTLAASFVSERATNARPALLTHDLLAPVPRDRFFAETGLAFVADVLILWAAAQLTALVGFCLLIPDLLAQANAATWLQLPVAASYLVVAIGVVAWLLRLRPGIPGTFARHAVCVFAVVILVPLTNTPRLLTPTVAAGLSTFLLLLGLTLLVGAHHKWSEVEPA